MHRSLVVYIHTVTWTYGHQESDRKSVKRNARITSWTSRDDLNSLRFVIRGRNHKLRTNDNYHSFFSEASTITVNLNTARK